MLHGCSKFILTTGIQHVLKAYLTERIQLKLFIQLVLLRRPTRRGINL